MIPIMYLVFDVLAKCGIVMSSVACRYKAFACISDRVSKVFSGRINASVGCYIEVL